MLGILIVMTKPKKNALSSAKGNIIVICGPMFAGKSEELLRRIKRLQYAAVPYLIFKPKIDTRTSNTIKSRDGRELEAIEISSATEVFEHIGKITHFPFVIGFDEAQFFDDTIVEVAKILTSLKATVLIAGLDADSNYEPFGSMGSLLALADEVYKLTAICVTCGANASKTYRRSQTASESQILIGDQEIYEAICNKCYANQHQNSGIIRQIPNLCQHITQLRDRFYNTRDKSTKK